MGGMTDDDEEPYEQVRASLEEEAQQEEDEGKIPVINLDLTQEELEIVLKAMMHCWDFHRMIIGEDICGEKLRIMDRIFTKLGIERELTQEEKRNETI